MTNSVLSIIGLAVAIVVLLPLLIGGIFVIVVVANRADPDPTGRRPAAVYAFAISFVTLFTTLFATTGLVAALADLIGSHGGRSSSGLFQSLAATSTGGSQHPIGDAAARGAVLSIIVAMVAGAVFEQHIRRATVAAGESEPASPVGRVAASYVAAVSFVAVALAIGAAVLVCYDIFRIIGPGVFAPGLHDGRAAVLRSMLPGIWLGGGALLILLAHLRHAPAPFRSDWWDRRRPAPAMADSDHPAAP